MARLPILAVLLGVAACATMPKPVGHDYDQAAFGRFNLDQTTVAEAEALLGPPVRQATLSGIAKPGSTLVAPGTPMTLTALSYYWAPNGFGLPRNQHPAKTATLSFINGVLAEYTLSNAIPGEVMPPIDEGRLGDLHQGRTTRSEAIAMFGLPIRQFVHKLDAQRGSSEIAYGWSHAEGGTVTLRTLHIYFDRAGLMSSYAVLDNNFPANSLPLPFAAPTPPQIAPSPPQSLPPRPPVDREHT